MGYFFTLLLVVSHWMACVMGVVGYASLEEYDEGWIVRARTKPLQFCFIRPG